jgi:hypothetical protein
MPTCHTLKIIIWFFFSTQALIHHENQQRLQSNHCFAPFLEAGRRRLETAADSYNSTFSPPSHTSGDSITTFHTSSMITTTSTSTNTSYTSNTSNTSSSQPIENSISSNDPPPPSLVGALVNDFRSPFSINHFNNFILETLRKHNPHGRGSVMMHLAGYYASVTRT